MFVAKKSKSSSRKPIKIAHKVIVAEELKISENSEKKAAQVKVEEPVAEVAIDVEQVAEPATKPAGKSKRNKANSEDNSDSNKNEE